jgi:S1-C subfamily serine protease
LTIGRVDVADDLALLVSPQAIEGQEQGLIADSTVALRGEHVRVFGYPFGGGLLLSAARVDMFVTLRDLLPPNLSAQMTVRNSPDVSLLVYELEGHVLPGDDGAPVLRDNDEVVAVANGGSVQSDEGARIAWAIPITGLKWVQPDAARMQELMHNSY